MITIKWVGTKPTILNGFVLQQGHTRTIGEKQAQSLVDEDPTNWQVEGGMPNAEEPKAREVAKTPEPTRVTAQSRNAKVRRSKKK